MTAAGRAVADAVLFEGYLLYPYRSSSLKNRYRWQFGVLAPPAWSAIEPSERSSMRAEVLVDANRAPSVTAIARFLRLQTAGGRDGWDTGLEACVEVTATDECRLARAAFRLDPAHACIDGRRAVAHSLTGDLAVRLARRGSRSWALSVELRNRSSYRATKPTRDGAMRRSMVGTHLLLSVDAGRFVSVLDPGEHADEVRGLATDRNWYPVLVGPRGTAHEMLVSPVALDDHPSVDPRSAQAFFDATEIDEMLALRVATLTEDERRAARATDPRGKVIVDHVHAMTQEDWTRLHAEMVPHLPAPTPSEGDKVRLQPKRAADAQDLFLRGRVATVRRVMEDVDGRVYVAVTVDDDPGADLHMWYGRFHYFDVDEVEPL